MNSFVPFPDELAGKVVEYAKKAGNQVVVEFVDKIRDCLGHPEVVNDRNRAWGVEAVVGITEAQSSVGTCKRELSAYWQGPAYDAFGAYIKELEEVMKETSAAFTDYSGLLRDASAQIAKTYIMVIDFLAACGESIIRAAGTIAAKWKELWGGVAEAILNALAEFVSHVRAAFKELISIINNFVGLGQKLEERIVKLQIPSPVGGSVSDPDNWRVKKRDKQ